MHQLREQELFDVITQCVEVLATGDKNETKMLLDHALVLAEIVLKERIEWEESGCP